MNLLATISRSGLVLGLFAVCTVAFIAITATSTAAMREANVQRAAQKNLFALLPPDTHDNDLLQDVVPAPAGGLLGNEEDELIRIARIQGEIVGVVLPVTAPDAYSGRIRMIVGVRPDGTLLGVRVLAHRETPGLGDKVDLRKSDWILGFRGRSLQNPAPDGWKVRRDGGEFDQFTGATITPRSVVRAVYRALRHFEAHGADIMQPRIQDEMS